MSDVLSAGCGPTLPTPYYEEAGITIYNARNEDILPLLPPYDLILTDPPYGVSMKRGDSKISRAIQNDLVPPDIAWMSKGPAIIWGGNNFCDQLPRSTGWLVWYKYNHEKSHHSQAELAWTNVVKTIRHWSQQYGGFMRAPEGWWHPTQKPTALMRWCLSFVPHATVVLDPYMGAGASLLAAKACGLKAIGIETEERDCESAVTRLQEMSVLPFPPPHPAVVSAPGLFGEMP